MDTVSVYAPGHWDPYDSYGRIACELARYLDRLGVRVNAMGHGERQIEWQDDEVKRITGRPLRMSAGGILLGYPTSFASYNPLAQVGPRIAVTMFESSRIPASWIPVLNGMDAVIVPSTFCRESFRDSGVKVPVHVLPLGISRTFKPTARRIDNRPFTFLTWGDRGKRKGGLMAVGAFAHAFGYNMNYRLLVKTREGDARAECLNPNVETLRLDLTEQQLFELYVKCDAMVFPTKGEGFGLPPREFAATGAPVITTNWSGTADDIGLWGIPLDYELEPADWEGYSKFASMGLGEWAKPDIEHLARLMQDVARDNRDAHRLRALWNAPYIHDLYSWDNFARGALDIWRKARRKYVEDPHGNREPDKTLAR